MSVQPRPTRPGGRHLLRSSAVASEIVRDAGIRPGELVEADARAVPWPREPFRVVANLPFALAAELCRSLLDDPSVPLAAADLIVEWDFAAKRARLWPSTAQTVVWSAWYELTVARRLLPSQFAPPPSVAAGVLRARRRSVPLVPERDARRFERFVRDGFRRDRHARELDPHAWAVRFGSYRARR